MRKLELFDRLNPRRDLPQVVCDVISRVYEVMSRDNVVWHDLRKDPDDLPDTGSCVLVHARTERGYRYTSFIEYREDEDGVDNFIDNDGDVYTREVIAWCYPPEFEEGEAK